MLVSGFIWDEMSWAIGVGIGVVVFEILVGVGLVVAQAVALPSILELF